MDGLIMPSKMQSELEVNLPFSYTVVNEDLQNVSTQKQSKSIKNVMHDTGFSRYNYRARMDSLSCVVSVWRSGSTNSI